MKLRFTTKAVIVAMLLIGVIIGVIIGCYKYTNYKVTVEVDFDAKVQSELTQKLQKVCSSHGLKDVTITFDGRTDSGLEKTVITTSSNLSDLSNDSMIKLGKDLDGCKTGLVRGFIIEKIVSNNDIYKIYGLGESGDSIYKNGVEIYDSKANNNSTATASSTEASSNITSNSNSTYNQTNQNSSSGLVTKVTNEDELGACYALAEKVVKANLKSPSSAKFPFSYNSDGVSITKNGDTYTVVGYVDAENSYGAKLRSDFVVTMTKSGSGANALFTEESCVIE